MNDNRKNENDIVECLRKTFNQDTLFFLETIVSRERISNSELNDLYYLKYGKVVRSSFWTGPVDVLKYRGLLDKVTSDYMGIINYISKPKLKRFYFDIVQRAIKDTDFLIFGED